MEPEIFHLMNKKQNNKNKKNDNSSNRVWSQKCSAHEINIPKVMSSQDKEFNYAYSLLFSDNRDIKMNKPIYKRRKINNKKKTHFLKYISSDSEKILNKAYTKINYMKNESKELQKLNSLSLQKISKSYFRTNRPKTSNINYSLRKRNQNSSTNINYQTQAFNLSNNSKILKKRSYNSLKNIFEKKKTFEFTNGTTGTNEKNDKKDINNLYSNENTKENTNPNLNLLSNKINLFNSFNKNKKIDFSPINKSKNSLKSNFNPHSPINLFANKGEEKYRNLINIDIPKLYSINKKKNLNLSRFNDTYRIQMNKTLKHYNAVNHLKDLNKIQRDDISVRESMEKIKSKVNQKIDDRCQGQYYKKQYIKLKEENEKGKKENRPKKIKYPDQVPFNILFRDANNKKKIKVFPHGYKIRAFYDFSSSCERIQKSNDKDLFDFGTSLLFKHFNNKNYDLLYNSLDELFNSLEIKPIIKYIDKFKNEKSIKDKNILNERIKKYFPALTETEKNLQKIEQHFKKKNNNFKKEDLLEIILETKKLLNSDK